MPGQFAHAAASGISRRKRRAPSASNCRRHVESVREFDARTQRSVAPVVRTTFSLTEWACRRGDGSWDLPSYWGQKRRLNTGLLESVQPLRPIVFLDESPASSKAFGNSSPTHGTTNATVTRTRNSDISSGAMKSAHSLAGVSQIQMEELALNVAAENSFRFLHAPAPFFTATLSPASVHKVATRAGGTVYLPPQAPVN